MKKGKTNSICDVAGVKVGHKTIANGDIQTGVSVIIPHDGNIFQEKLMANCAIINGFGKTTGLVQLQELGTLESYIALTNTLSVGTVQQALVKYMLKDNPDIGTTTGTINVIVGECNDMSLNNIRACAIQEEDVYEAIANASNQFALGSVGAGRGMSCFQMSGGIGTSSRIITIDEQDYTIGVLVLSNYGLKDDLLWKKSKIKTSSNIQEQGSIIMVIACDIPLDSRQLQRVCKRMSVPLARSGSYLGNGSGDIAIAFSTANKIKHHPITSFQSFQTLHESKIDIIFRNAIDACEEAIYRSLLENETITGFQNKTIYSYNDTFKHN